MIGIHLYKEYLNMYNKNLSKIPIPESIKPKSCIMYWWNYRSACLKPSQTIFPDGMPGEPSYIRKSVSTYPIGQTSTHSHLASSNPNQVLH
jgi:hypothetical protein